MQKVRALGAGRLVWRLFQRVDMFVGPSPAAVTELLANGVPPHKAVCIPNLIDTAPAGADSKRTLRQALGLPERPICLFVGRLIAVKGLDVLMQAWPAVRARHDAALVVVGDGPDRDALDRWAQAPEQQGSVRVLGWQADPDPFYRVADLLVFPSRLLGIRERARRGNGARSADRDDSRRPRVRVAPRWRERAHRAARSCGATDARDQHADR